MKSEAKFSADKKELRSYIKIKRKSVENKAEKDSLVAQNLLSLDEIKKRIPFCAIFLLMMRFAQMR